PAQRGRPRTPNASAGRHGVSPPQRPSVHTPAVGVAADEPARHDRLMTIFEQSAQQLPSLDPDWRPLPAEVDATDAPSAPVRAWFLGEGPLPREEPTDPAGLETMRREAEELPLLAEFRCALDLIGDGLRVKRGGDPYVSDVREFERRRGARIPRHEAPCSPTFPELVDLLRTLGWVESEERRLRRVEESAAEAALDPETEGHLDAVRDVIRAGVRRAQARPCWLVATTPEHTLRDAPLLAPTPEGLLPPWPPRPPGGSWRPPRSPPSVARCSSRPPRRDSCCPGRRARRASNPVGTTPGSWWSCSAIHASRTSPSIWRPGTCPHTSSRSSPPAGNA